jgi:pimeloyl-ACP methyl ester carboxylesterase
MTTSRWLALVLLAGALGCEPLSLDPFLYDPLVAPPSGYQLSTAVIPTHEDLFVPTPDGQTLHVVFVPAAAPLAADAPQAIVYFHGQSNNIGTSWPRIEALYPLGWPIYAVDPRGYGRSTGSPSEAGIDLDLESLARYLVDVRKHEPGRLVIYGRSLGGAFAIHLATLAPPRVLVTESAFTSVAALVADGAYAPVPVSFVAKSRWDNLGKIRTVNRPYLVLHGTADPYVRFHYGEELVDAHPGVDQLVAVPGADHGDVPTRLGLAAYHRLIRQFVAENPP